jgi:hypothetical protein
MRQWQPIPVGLVQDIIEGAPGAVEALAAFAVSFRGLVRDRSVSVRRAAAMTGASKSRAHRAQQEARAFFSEWQEGRTVSRQSADTVRTAVRQSADTGVKEEPQASLPRRTPSRQSQDTSRTPAGHSQARGSLQIQIQPHQIHSEQRTRGQGSEVVLAAWGRAWVEVHGSPYLPDRADRGAAGQLAGLTRVDPEQPETVARMEAAIGAYLRGYRWPKIGPPTVASFASVAGRWLNRVSQSPPEPQPPPPPQDPELPQRAPQVIPGPRPAPPATAEHLSRWPETLKRLRQNLGPQTVDIWLRPLQTSLRAGVLVLQAPNTAFLPFASEYLEPIQEEVGAQVVLCSQPSPSAVRCAAG